MPTSSAKKQSIYILLYLYYLFIQEINNYIQIAIHVFVEDCRIHCLVTSQKDLDKGSRNFSPTCPFPYTARQTCKNRQKCSCAHGQSVTFNPALICIYIYIVVYNYTSIFKYFIHFYMHNKYPVHQKKQQRFPTYSERSFSHNRTPCIQIIYGTPRKRPLSGGRLSFSTPSRLLAAFEP